MHPDGTYDLAELGLDGLASAPGMEWAFLDADHAVAEPGDLAGLDAVVLEMMDVREASLAGVERLTLVARYGVGFDSVDVDACTRRGILVSNAPDGVRRPMAAVNLALLLALSMRLVQKDRLTRAGRWDEGVHLLGSGLMGRTLGLVGMGNIGAETLRLARPLDMRLLVYDPYVADERVRAEGAEPATLEQVLRESDHVILGVPLTPATRGLIGAPELALMKPAACLVNTTRGPIVDEAALVDALRAGRLAGAALDVFEREPIDPANPLLGMDNVIVTPHSLGSTDECFAMIGHSVVAALTAVAAGRPPQHVVNRAVLDHPAARERLAELAAGVASPDAAKED
jgi:D-3-phosphoglycerate dehydrogenase